MEKAIVVICRALGSRPQTAVVVHSLNGYTVRVCLATLISLRVRCCTGLSIIVAYGKFQALMSYFRLTLLEQ